jgi:uncharacterized membrane protein YphA (DoxX/SURF4 family)
MARVPSDPAQVIVTHASFRVQLGRSSARSLGLGAPLLRQPGTPQRHTAGAAAGRRRLAPVVWSGRPGSGEPLPGELFQAVRQAGVPDPDGSAGATTQVLPRVDAAAPPPTVVAPRSGQAPTGLLGGVRPARGAYDDLDDAGHEPVVGYTGGDSAYDGEYGTAYGGPYGGPDDPDDPYGDERPVPRRERRNPDFVKHAWYPGRRMNLGIVLLPLRIFLGFVSIYAGMGKLCDRVYFDGGKRGSMVTWLSSLHPWAVAEPLRDTALNHPVGAGLSIAFLQVVVGVLTVCGLWQRVAASFGAALSIALLVTVSWRTVPVYDAPDFIYLAAWSPLVIAGAPVYSVDGKLAADAWRRLGPRVGLWDLRRYVLRRGMVLGTFIVGGSLLLGSVLGAAVRATSSPGGPAERPATPPVNQLPGMPLPEVSGGDDGTAPGDPTPTRTPKAHKSSAPPAATPTATTESRTHAPEGGTRAPSSGSGGSSSGGSSSGGSGGSDGTSSAPPPAAPPTHEAPPPPPPPTDGGAIGGLLGAPLLGAPREEAPIA